MKTSLVPTNSYYHRILDAPDAAARHQLYLDLLVEPWGQMMQMMQRGTPPDQVDPLDGARAWAWLLPDQVTQMAATLQQLEAADAWGVVGGTGKGCRCLCLLPRPSCL